MPTDSPVYYNKQQLEEKMRGLVRQQVITRERKPLQQITPILDQSKEILTQTYRYLAREAKKSRDLSSAGEWLLDNFYIIQEQIVQLREDLPSSYYKKLPRLKEGAFAGYPRVYELVQTLAVISDNIIDQENTTIAVQAYQEKVMLELGELWAIPILIRVSLIDRLAEKSGQLLEQRKVHNRVDKALDKILESSSEEPGYLIRKLTEIEKTENAGEQFLTILAQRIQVAGLLTESERSWFDYKFRKWNSTIEDQLRIEAQRTSRLHVSIQNAISTLRQVSENDWSEFVEDCSVVERILRLDPSGYYPKMDFQTRDRYRKVIEKLSTHSSKSEQQVAQQVLILSERAGQKKLEGHVKKMHVGYYLFDEGFTELARELNYRMPFNEKIKRWLGRHPGGLFTFIVLNVLVLLTVVGLFTGVFQSPWWLIGLALAATFFPALDLAVVSTNRILSMWLPPRILPKLEMEHAISHKYRTLIVVPTLFSSPEDVLEQFEQLEIRSLANPRRELQFVMLSDFTDADKETEPTDKAIIDAAKEQVRQLNHRYSSSYGNKFFLLHRKRNWNPVQNTWMGWERKRGKLEEFNRLLRNPEAETTFSTISDGFLESVQDIPVVFVITLDADTKLPPSSAKDLIRTAAHPMNRAEVDESGAYVKRGYGIIQPRISIPPKSAGKTWFSRIFAGNVGLDPYTTAVSDSYQDLFGEGIFTGKGIYDVEVFNTVLKGRFPDNTILSHDLLESTYLRCGLAPDIELFDDYPTSYLNTTKRNHRWIRGDWQILSWLFPHVPGGNGELQSNPINSVSRWKIFDNLRRSLTPFFLLILLLFGWTILPGSPFTWTLAVLGITTFSIYSSFSAEIFARPSSVKWKLYLEKIRSNLKINTLQAATTFIFLPHQAYISVDATVRTLWRMYVSRKNLLEWTTASQTERDTNNRLLVYWEKMWVNVIWSILCVSVVWIVNPSFILLIIPFGILWLAAPSLAYLLSTRSPISPPKALGKTDIRELRMYARRTWHYFEQYVNEDQSWLAPDNFQEEPFIGTVARTSPTNIGLGLASTYTAYEFGYLTVETLTKRVSLAIDSMKMMERYSGHFYNWYSTKLGEALQPRYISTVDSGNLAAGLLYLNQAIEELQYKPWPNPDFWNGLQDTANVLQEITGELQTKINGINLWAENTSGLLRKLAEQIPTDISGKPEEWEEKLIQIQPEVEKLEQLDFRPLLNQLSDVEREELADWFCRPLLQVQDQLGEIQKVLESGKISGDKESWKVKDILALPSFDKVKSQLTDIRKSCDTWVQEMDFGMLYDQNRDLFRVGYNVEHASFDKSTYDLLASEARLASFIAIAKGDIPPKHWFKLSRRLTSIERNEILLSWGGTMFEYLMPLLFLASIDDTLLSKTYENAVRWQKKYGESHNRPWGFSESGYSVLNLELHYQYRAFGAPGLGLRRGLAEDYVVSPYSSLLALMVSPHAALDNLRRLKNEGAYGLNGFYEAIDYTPKRGEGRTGKNLVKMYMAHHQGMGLLALANVIKENVVQELFHGNSLIKSCDLLLQERIPRGFPIKEPRPIDIELEPAEEQKSTFAADHAGKEELNDSPPRTHILSNGKYSTVITHAGTGYSAFDDMALTRWRAERVKDAMGFFFYVKDLDSNEFWSAGHRPVNRVADRYDTWFHAGMVQIARVDEWIETFTEICVSPEDNIELRKITLTNYSDRPRRLELTSYAEVVLNSQEADAAHPAFSNLFVQTDYNPEHHAIIAKRRPRDENEEPVWLVHTIASEDLYSLPEPLQFETDRDSFIGRGRSLDNPIVMDPGGQLHGSIGNIPDPIVSMRRIVELRPGEKKSVTFGLGTVNSREEADDMVDRYDNPYAIDRVFELASIYGRVELDHVGIDGKQAHYFQKLAGALLYDNEQLRAGEDVLMRNRRKQSGLWPYGISGDIPILVYRISDVNHLRYIEQLLKAHMIWRLKNLSVDLVIIYDHPPSYIMELRDAINRQIQASPERNLLNKRGGIFVIHGDEMPVEDRILLETVAAVKIEGKLPVIDFSTDLKNDKKSKSKTPYRLVRLSELNREQQDAMPNLLHFNEYGGFSLDGKEYVIHLKANSSMTSLVFPPAPWVNVIANPDFGFITSERGSDYTWSLNSRENRLTPWSNDTVIDPAGEVLYVRDENSRLFWSPTPGPSPGSAHYEVRHGFGYSRFISQTMNIHQEVTKWVPIDDPVKLIRVRLTNSDLIPRTLSVFHYLEWVLGVLREQSSRFVVTEFDSELRTIFARNHYNNEFAGRTAFATHYTDTEQLEESFTADRKYFIGKNKGVTNPQALRNDERLRSRFGTGFDPCAASQVQIQLNSGETADIYFMLGETETTEEARKLISFYRDVSSLEASLDEVQEFWKRKLGKIQIATPQPELNLLFNGWLQYQNIACRMWARSGFYQSGGAFGFRDQLQDAMAALYSDAQLSRQQILKHAAHQFTEGDVLHWWHPPTARGVRSRISDDLLWLPYVTAFYVDFTGDREILDENIPFITARNLEDGEHENYLIPQDSGEQASLYEHCCRAIDRSLTTGQHGLPLIGGGDWNDGMNRVGVKGKGESVWLGFFLYTVLEEFIPLCRQFEDKKRVEQYSAYQKKLKKNLNEQGWDGKWYRRAYYDDGTPLGSSENEECRIDAIAQAWAVISGVAPEEKAQLALQSAAQHLISWHEGIIRLLTPPFDRTEQNPGYIKGYIPGVRENGGQYTHAALWLVRAFAEMGYHDYAIRLIRMLSPVTHTGTKKETDRYRTEPYAVAADIYGEPPLTGMGGWTWYTGSAGWMYRVLLESILGIKIVQGNILQIEPRNSEIWPTYTVEIKAEKNTTYHISVFSSEEVKESDKLEAVLDGKPISTSDTAVTIEMESDGQQHTVELDFKPKKNK